MDAMMVLDNVGMNEIDNGKDLPPIKQPSNKFINHSQNLFLIVNLVRIVSFERKKCQCGLNATHEKDIKNESNEVNICIYHINIFILVNKVLLNRHLF